MTSGQFRTNYPPAPVLPLGSLLNKYGSALNSLLPALVASRRNYNGIGNQSIGDMPFIMGVVEITGPGPSGNQYVGKFLYKNTQTGEWEKLDTEVTLDADMYDPAPEFSNGDRVAAWYDPRTFLCLPVNASTTSKSSNFKAAYVFRGNTNTTVPFVDVSDADSLYVDAPLVSLEQFIDNSWRALLPELTVSNGPTYQSGGSGSVPIALRLQHNDFFRMTCGTEPFSLAEHQIFEHGVRIILVAKIGGSVSATTIHRRSRAGVATLSEMNLVGVEASDLQAPVIEHIGAGVLRVTMASGNESDEWLALADIWAEAQQSIGHPVFAKMQRINTGGTGGGNQTNGAICTPIDGYHEVLLADYNNGGNGAFNYPLRCFLRFTDWHDEEFGVVPAEVGKIYGPCQHHGTAAVGNFRRPLLLAPRGHEEYIAKLVNPLTLPKGETGTFALFNRDRTTSGITRQAVALGSAITSTSKWCGISRVNGGLYIASPLEC